MRLPEHGRAAAILDRLRVPIVQAPLAGGPSTPELTIAAGQAGALGFLAAGYRGAHVLRDDIRRVRAAMSVQVGTALLDTPEAGTSAPHRAALRGSGRTRLTRAFSGRRARGIVNGFMERNEAAAPSGYPHVHFLTAPMRAAARACGDAELINLWAGQGYALMPHGVPAEDVIARMADEIRAALDGARARL